MRLVRKLEMPQSISNRRVPPTPFNRGQIPSNVGNIVDCIGNDYLSFTDLLWHRVSEVVISVVRKPIFDEVLALVIWPVRWVWVFVDVELKIHGVPRYHEFVE